MIPVFSTFVKSKLNMSFFENVTFTLLSSALLLAISIASSEISIPDTLDKGRFEARAIEIHPEPDPKSSAEPDSSHWHHHCSGTFCSLPDARTPP